MPATRHYRVRFFRLAVYDPQGQRLAANLAGQAISTALTAVDPLPQISLVQDYSHQVREVRWANPNRLEGCFAKLRPDAPHIVRAATNQELTINLQPGDKIVDKSYLIFFPSVSLLTFQMNRDGGSISRFMEYLSRLMPQGYVTILEEMINADTLNRLGQHEVKWIEVAFVRPRNVQNINPHDWTDNTIQALGGLNAGRVQMKISAPRAETLGDRASNFLERLFRNGEAVTLKAKFDDIYSPVDLLAEVVQGNIEVQLREGYPHPAAILDGMLQVYEQQRGRLQAIIGDVEHLP